MHSKQSVAVIGSGVSGLTASWLLKDKFKVSLFEKAARLGMGQKGVDIVTDEGSKRVDIPIRVYASLYYPNLHRLCQIADVPVRYISQDSSFSTSAGETYFRYYNLLVKDFSLSYVLPKLRYGWKFSRMVYYYLRLMRDINQANFDEKYRTYTLEEFVHEKKYPASFCKDFIYPVFASIATSKLDTICHFPATVLFEMLRKMAGTTRTMKRWVGGTTQLEETLASSVEDKKFGLGVQAIERHQEGVLVYDDAGEKHQFDKVVVALQANQAASVLGETFRQEKDLLSQIPHETTTMSVHKDPSLMPNRREDWASVNYMTTKKQTYPVATLWINRSEPEFQSYPEDLFQTLNPPEKVSGEVTRTQFQRPMVTLKSLKAVSQLRDLQSGDETRSVFFCGSYLAEKIPLLENGVVSAFNIAKALKVPLPFELQ